MQKENEGRLGWEWGKAYEHSKQRVIPLYCIPVYPLIGRLWHLLLTFECWWCYLPFFALVSLYFCPHQFLHPCHTIWTPGTVPLLLKYLFTWMLGSPGKWGNPVRWGNPPAHISFHFHFIAFTWWVGWPTVDYLTYLSWGPPPPCTEVLIIFLWHVLL